MSVTLACFASRRYWDHEETLQRAFEQIAAPLRAAIDQAYLITEAGDLDALPKDEGGLLLVVPMSGAIQPLILEAAQSFTQVVLFAGYVRGNTGEMTEQAMLLRNAAPTLMDCWSVLRRTHSAAQIALDARDLDELLRIHRAVQAIRSSKILLIGETEPWVVSVPRELSLYQRLGVEIIKISQSELADAYQNTSDQDAAALYEKYWGGAREIVEPTAEHVRAACRMAHALVGLAERYRTQALAIACFDLLKLGTNACLGVSFLNDCTEISAACEGDLDSAYTMLMMRALTDARLFMANPGLQPDGSVNFSHCTAPLSVDGRSDCPYILRNHHESGIGASLQVELPLERRVTACRYSAFEHAITIQNGTSVAGAYEPCCRTQLHIRWDDPERYIRTALGCHQTLCFDDISRPMNRLARQLGLTVIE